MAATQSLRLVRRPKGGRPAPSRALTAASQPLPDPSQVFSKSTGISRNSDWQTDAWEAVDLVGELRYYVGWRASSCSRCRLVASELDENTGLPTGGISEDNTEGERVREIVSKIADGTLGQAALTKRVVECLTVPGELWIVILTRPVKGAPAQPDGSVRTRQEWYAVSKEEIKKSNKGSGTNIVLPTGEEHEFVKGTDIIFRVWIPKPRKASEPDSPVRAVLDSIREIVRTTKTIANASKSRLIGNGVLFVPHEMSLPAAQGPVSEVEGEEIAPLVGEPAVQQLTDMLFQVAETAVEDEDSQAAFIPVIAGVPGEQIKDVKHIRFDNEITEVAIKTRNDAIARLAMGLDVSPERLLGLGSQTNHWSAWQISDEDVQLHIAPVMEIFCQALTDQILRVTLAREGIDPSKYVVWYDPSQLTIDPDKSDEAKFAYENGAINGEALRKYLGLGDDAGYDFTTREGWVMWAQDAVSKDPTLIPMLAPLIAGVLKQIEFPQQQQAIDSGGNEDTSDADDLDDGEQEPDTEDDQDDDGTQKAGLETGIVDLMVDRALELVGKRRRGRDRETLARLSGVRERDYHRYMDPVPESEVDRLMSGWDSALDDKILLRLGLDPGTIRSAVRRKVMAELTRPVIDVVA